MINSTPPVGPTGASEDEAFDVAVRAGPGGALLLAGVATAVVVALWLAFYVLVFLPRGSAQ